MKTVLPYLLVSACIALGFIAVPTRIQSDVTRSDVTRSGVTYEEPWLPAQLMEPAELADRITSSDANKPLIISIGPAATIKTSVGVGPGSEAENRARLAELVGKEPKTREIVIYCGCCPFAKCPNIRPAFTALNELGFKNHRLLNVARNLKTDWIDKGYPVID